MTYVAATGVLEAWVRVPTLSATDVTALWLYYGGAPRAVLSTPTWRADLEAVWHLSEAGPESDSTNHGHGLTGGGSLGVVPGIAGGARIYDGSGTLSGGDPSDGSLDFGASSFSMSTWVRVSESRNDYDMPIFKGAAQAALPGFCFLLGFGSWGVNFSDGTNEAGVVFGTELDLLGSWVQLVVVVDRSVPELRSYTNGALAQSSMLSLGSFDTSIPLEVGGPTEFRYAGLLDETRFYRRAVSADWIRAEYLNLARRSEFLLLGAEEAF